MSISFLFHSYFIPFLFHLYLISGGLFTPWYFPYGIHMEWMESNPIPWTPYGLFFGWQPSHSFISYPLWSPYGIHMEWTIPWTFHVLVHVDSIEFLMNLHCKFMYYSIWIPWNSPYGFHGRIHIKFPGQLVGITHQH